MKTIYLDYNASTPIAPEVIELMTELAQSCYGNPSAQHYFGKIVRQRIEKARKDFAETIACFPDEIVFTSGGTESNNLAILGTMKQFNQKHMITNSTEHPAVIQTCKALENDGTKVSYLPVDCDGIISLSELEKSINADTKLITIMHSNNETGVIQAVDEIAKIAKKYNILFHTDAAQSFGKIPLHKNTADMISFAGHKFYAPVGIGVLYMKRGVKLSKIISGASQEFNLRPGTENVIGISAIAKAAQIATANFHSFNFKTKRDKLQTLILSALSKKDIIINGKNTLPNTLNFSVQGLNSNKLLSEIGDLVAFSTGSACHAQSENASYVLKAMNVPADFIFGTLRLSVGRETSNVDIENAAQIISESILRQIK